MRPYRSNVIFRRCSGDADSASRLSGSGQTCQRLLTTSSSKSPDKKGVSTSNRYPRSAASEPASVFGSTAFAGTVTTSAANAMKTTQIKSRTFLIDTLPNQCSTAILYRWQSDTRFSVSPHNWGVFPERPQKHLDGVRYRAVTLAERSRHLQNSLLGYQAVVSAYDSLVVS